MIKSIKLKLSILMAILSLLIGVSFFLYFQEELILTPILLLLTSILLFFYILYLLDTTNRALSNFFDYIKYEDDSLQIGIRKKGKSFEELYVVLNSLKDELLKEKINKTANLKFLEFIIDSISIGILVIQQEKIAVFSNQISRDIFRFRNNDLSQSKDNLDLLEKISIEKHNTNFVHRIWINSKPYTFLVKIKNIISNSLPHKLIILEDIDEKLNETEQEAWESLIRVLTHEIMNSMTPIQSLTDTVLDIISDTPIKKEDRIDIEESLHTIKSRSKGLEEFVISYKNLAILDKPKFEEIDITELFDNVKMLFKNQLKELKINFKIKIQEIKKIFADRAMLEQVLVNLILNAIEAVKFTKLREIMLVAKYNEIKTPIIKVIDSGYGIDNDNLEKIFVPFYTTKRKGSGIGLNLCKQIMKLHKGNIQVKSEQNSGTEFSLIF